MNTPTGYEVYHGPSLLDGHDIVAVVTLTSSNAKTGPMAQTWIMRADMPPIEASKQQLDGSVCGSCIHRQSLGGACYVQLVRGPGQVWKAWAKGKYPKLDGRALRRLQGRPLRLGAYGDPAAVPVAQWRRLVKTAGMTTGYTHQQHHPAFDPALLDFCMVSVDSVEQKAETEGRTFRVKLPEQPLESDEVLCPASYRDVQCIDCGLCSGAHGNGRSVAIDVHGALSNRYRLIATG